MECVEVLPLVKKAVLLLKRIPNGRPNPCEMVELSALESRRKIHPATRGRVVQNNQCAGDAKATPLSFPAPPTFVHEQ
jgi:hypothetical protein